MRIFLKIVIIIVSFIFIFFVIPALSTKRVRVSDKSNENLSENNENDKEQKEEKKYDYSKYGKIKLLHKDSNQVEELSIDEYLKGVVSAEMPANYEIEALKAQAIVARTYTIYQIENNKEKHVNADICDDFSCCQAWISKEQRMKKWKEEDRQKNWDKIVEAVNSTAGKIITYNHVPINAFFHSNSGGITETVSNVWSGKDLPYLQSVETSGEDEYQQYFSEVKISKENILKKLKENYKDISINFDDMDCIKIISYTQSGRAKNVKFGNAELAGTEVRKLFELKSTNFIVKVEDDNIIFSVKGNGHGVGMSQTGANSMAKSGKLFDEIIKHFYTGVEIESL